MSSDDSASVARQVLATTKLAHSVLRGMKAMRVIALESATLSDAESKGWGKLLLQFVFDLEALAEALEKSHGDLDLIYQMAATVEGLSSTSFHSLAWRFATEFRYGIWFSVLGIETARQITRGERTADGIFDVLDSKWNDYLEYLKPRFDYGSIDWLCSMVDKESALAQKSPEPVRSTDTGEKSADKLPGNSDVRDLCYLLQENVRKGKLPIQIAREFTREKPKHDKKAQSLLRQARRYRHLWDRPDT